MVEDTPPGEAGARSPTLTLAARGPLFDCHRALLDRIELGFPSRQFGRYAIPAKPSKRTWERVQLTLPFVGVCWLGLTPDGETGRILSVHAGWLIYLGCKNQLPDQLLTGDTYGVGQLGMASLCAALLHGWSVPGLGTWSVRGVDNSAIQDWVDEQVGVVAIQASCTLRLIDDAAAAALPEFLREGATCALPPIGGAAQIDTLRAA